jgi:ABC-type multidrug transport system fused ATPase/permease subunit
VKEIFRFFIHLLRTASLDEKGRLGLIFFLNISLSVIELCIAGLVGLMAAAFASPASVLQNRHVVSFQNISGIALPQEHASLLLAILGTLLCSVLLKNSIGIYAQWQFVTLSHTLHRRIKASMMRFFLRTPFLWAQKKGGSEMLFTFYAGDVTLEASIHALNMLSNVCMLIMLLAGLLMAAPVPSLILILFLGITGSILICLLRAPMGRLATAAFAKDREKHDLQLLAVNAFRELRMTSRAVTLLRYYTDALLGYMWSKRKHMALMRVPAMSLEVLGIASLVLVLLYVIFIQHAGMGYISGVMGIMAGAAWRALPMVNRVVENVNGLLANLPHIRLMLSLRAEKQNLSENLISLTDTGPVHGMSFHHRLRLENIGLSYEGGKEKALEDVSFDIFRGSMVGIIGLSGAGKSSLVNVLTGLIAPQSGGVYIDSVRVGRENSPSWMRRVGYVPQSPFILNDTLAVNVALCDWGSEINREQVLKCCKMAALDFLDDLENGLDTVLGERGTRLSGGQIQRIAIARALYGVPDLLVFDEATSALDGKNEKAIHETILALRSHVTLLIIAHRLSTIEGCDELIWLDKGKIRMQGVPAFVLPEYRKKMQRHDLNDDKV